MPVKRGSYASMTGGENKEALLGMYTICTYFRVKFYIEVGDDSGSDFGDADVLFQLKEVVVLVVREQFPHVFGKFQDISGSRSMMFEPLRKVSLTRNSGRRILWQLQSLVPF